MVQRPGQRQSISAASAVNARGAFWYCTYQGGLNAELFVTLLRQMMRGRSKPVHLVVDGLPAHKTALVKDYVASTDGMLTLHSFPAMRRTSIPDELVWSHMKRTGVARAPLRQGENLQDKITAQLAAIKRIPRLVRSFFQAPSVAYITDLSVMVAAIGGEPARFTPLLDPYRSACERLGQMPAAIGIHSVGYVADADAQAREAFWPHYKTLRDRIGAERGWPAFQRATLLIRKWIGDRCTSAPRKPSRARSPTPCGSWELAALT